MSEGPRRCSVCGLPLRASRTDTCGALSCVRLHRLRVPAPSKVRRCAYCSRTAAEDQEVCDTLRCRQFQANAVGAREREADRNAALDRMTRDHERDLRAVHPLPERLLHARLPASEATIAPLPAERRETFVTNVSSALNRAFDDPDRPVPESPESPARHAPLIRGACTACRGSCCKAGGEHAFLYPDHFRRLLRERPGRTREEILAEYLSHLPAESVHGSCVYHTATGCALPRGLRTNLCNTFLCAGLAAMLEAQPPEGPLLPVLAFCVRDHRADLVRSTVFDGDGSPILPE